MRYKIIHLSRYLLILLFFAVFSFLFLIKGRATANGVIEGLKICSGVVLPSLFPFTVLSVFMLKSGFFKATEKYVNKLSNKIFKLSGSELSVFIISLIGGYPIGAKLINDMYEDNLINESRAKKLLLASINGGPSFIIFTVGELILSNKNLGYVFFVSNLITSLLFLLILFFKEKNYKSSDTKTIISNSVADCFVLSVESACKMFLNICGWIILFSGILSGISAVLSGKSPFILLPLNLFLEITVGITKAKEFSMPIPMFSFLISFSGISGICQIKACLKNLNISFKCILASRIIHGIISSLITKTVLKLFPQPAYTLSNGITPQFNGFNLNIATVFLMVLCVFYIIYLNKVFFSKMHLKKQ